MSDEHFSKIGEGLLSARKSGSITTEDYHLKNAEWIAKDAEQYAPKPFPKLVQSAWDYCTKRLHSTSWNQFPANKTHYDQIQWYLHNSAETVHENKTNLRTLLWAAEILENVGKTEECIRIIEVMKWITASKQNREEHRIAFETYLRDTAEFHTSKRHG